jgi:hypothetical protein
MRTATLIAIASLLLPGCARELTAKADFPPRTTLSLEGQARCQNSGCRCRPLSDKDQAEQGIPAGKRRLELRLLPSFSNVWVSVAGLGVFYKSHEQQDETCFYVDLPAGDHALVLQADRRKVNDGLAAGLTIFEHGPPDRWYRTFGFACGLKTSECSREELQLWLDAERDAPRGDPCGTVRVHGVRAAGSLVSKVAQAYQDLTLRFRLRVSARLPRYPPGSPECR